MPISIEICDDPIAVKWIVTNPISVEDLVTGYASFSENPDYRSNMPSIWDATGLDLKYIPISDIRQLPRQMREITANRGEDYKAALVTGSAIDYQLLRMYLSILKMVGRNFKLRLFKNMDEAYAWIRT